MQATPYRLALVESLQDLQQVGSTVAVSKVCTLGVQTHRVSACMKHGATCNLTGGFVQKEAVSRNICVFELLYCRSATDAGKRA